MLKALYYPHTEIRSEVILRMRCSFGILLRRLFLELTGGARDPREIPNTGARLISRPPKLFDEATELIVRTRVPTQPERRAAHTMLSEMVENGLVDSLIRMSPQHWKQPEYLIYPEYPEKFLHETWHLLEQGGLARWEDASSGLWCPTGPRIPHDVNSGRFVRRDTNTARDR